MPQYKLDPAQFAKLKKKTLTRVIPIYVIILTVLITTRAFDPEKELDLVPSLIGIALFSGIVAFSLYRLFGRQRKMYDSYSVTIYDNLITREQLNTPTIS